jgi:phosphoenolpyruvate-protein kinase (PTS system EI component)
MRVLKGTEVVAGKAVGPAWILDPTLSIEERRIVAQDVRGELLRLERALARAEAQLGHGAIADEEGEPEAAQERREGQRRLLTDGPLGEAARRLVHERRISAESAVRHALDELDDQLARAPEPGRHHEIDEIEAAGDLLLRALLALPARAPVVAPEPGAIAVARELEPAEAAALARAGVAGIVTEHGAEGGEAPGVPWVTGVPGIARDVRPGLTIAVDGERGEVLVEPDEPTLRTLRGERDPDA